MTKTEIVALLLSSAVISGVVTTVLTYVFDIKKNKTSRNFQLRQEAYMKAIASVSGVSETIFDYFIKKTLVEGRLNPIIVTEFVAAHTREIAPAILVANNDIRTHLKKFSSLIIKGAAMIDQATLSAKKVNGQYILEPASPAGVDLRKWKEEIESHEDKIIEAMQKELGLKD